VIGAAAVIGPRCRIAPLAVLGRGVVLDRIAGSAAMPASRTPCSGAGLCLPGCPNRPGGVRLCRHVGGIPQRAATWPGDPAGRCRGRSEHDNRPGIIARHGDRGRLSPRQSGADRAQRPTRARLRDCRAGWRFRSTILEDHVMLGGQAGLTGHLRIGRRARIGAQAGVMSDVPADADVVGSPAQPVRAFFAKLPRCAGWCAATPSGGAGRRRWSGRGRKRSRRRIRAERDGRDHKAKERHGGG